MYPNTLHKFWGHIILKRNKAQFKIPNPSKQGDYLACDLLWYISELDWSSFEDEAVEMEGTLVAEMLMNTRNIVKNNNFLTKPC